MLQSAPGNTEKEFWLLLDPRNLLNGALAWIGSNYIGAAILLEIKLKGEVYLIFVIIVYGRDLKIMMNSIKCFFFTFIARL